MGKATLRSGIKILGSFDSGVGDPLLTVDSTTSVVGTVPSIDTSTFLSTSLSSGYLYVGNSSNIGQARQVTGQVLISNTGVTSIANDTITNSNINSAAGIAYSKLNLTTSIVNNDIAVAANISRSKLAAGNANRILINNGSGVFVDNAAITGSRVLVSDGSGLPTASSVTSTTLTYLDIGSSLTGLLTNKLQYTGSPSQGDILHYNGSAWVSLPIGASGYTLQSNGTDVLWDAGTINGIPVGGTTGQYLAKLSGTDFDADWTTLTLSKVTDVTALASEVNVLSGLTATTVEINYLSGVTSSIQTQLTNKLNNSLAQNSIWVGNASNQPAAVSAGTNGQVLTIVSGVPSWNTPATGASGGAADELQKNDGASGFAGTGLFSSSDGDLSLGTTTTSGAVRTIAVDGSATNVGVIFGSKGSGNILIHPGAFGGSGELQLYGLNASNVGGTVELGSTSGVSITRATANTNTVGNIKLTHVTTGTPATGIGTGLQFITETSSSNNEIGATIEAVTTNVGAGTEDFDLVFKTMDNGGAASTKLGLSKTINTTYNPLVIQKANYPYLNIFRPQILSDSTVLSDLFFDGYSDTSVQRTYSRFRVVMQNDVNTSENGLLTVSVLRNGSQSNYMDFDGANSRIVSYINHGFGGATSFGGGDGVMALNNASTNASSSIANGVIIHAKDSSDGAANSTLALYTEQSVEAIGTFTPSHKLKIWVNGVEYWVQLDAV